MRWDGTLEITCEVLERGLESKRACGQAGRSGRETTTNNWKRE